MATLTYTIKLVESENGENVLKIGFGLESHNGPKVRDAKAQLDALLRAGAFDEVDVIYVNGPCSMPVAMTIAHGLGHVVEAVACYDPKPNKYVVSICHGPKHHIGQEIDAAVVGKF